MALHANSWSVEKIIGNLKLHEKYETIAFGGKYISKRTEHFDTLFSAKMTTVKILSLLSSNLPSASVNNLLRAALIEAGPESISHVFFEVLKDSLHPSITNQDQFCSKVIEMIDFVQELHPTVNFEHLKFLTKCRYQKYHLVDEEMTKALIEINSVLHNQLAVILFAINEFDQALKYLPSKPSGILFGFVGYDPTYRQVLSRMGGKIFDSGKKFWGLFRI